MGKINVVGVLLWLVLVLTTPPNLLAKSSKFAPLIFNFGDSNSDTGGFSAGNGTDLVPPYGRVFFSEPSGRQSDGRVVLDLLCEHVGSSYLSPYMEALGSDFGSGGANFAVYGAAIDNTNLVPFLLSIQVNQFLHFKARSFKLHVKGYKNMITEKQFQKAVYSIDIGQNDLQAGFYVNLTSQQIIATLPSILSKIEGAIKTLYGSGARKFWVQNTGPLGCLPSNLAIYSQGSQDLDSCGCLASFNDASKAFNDGLNALCDKLRSQMKGVTIIYNDIYKIKYDIVCNYQQYGFDHPLMACCGSGGPPYNFNGKFCGTPGTQVCSIGSRRVSWDAIHYTEAANVIVASKLLSSNYSNPPIKLEALMIL